jgi:hypothetical protein
MARETQYPVIREAAAEVAYAPAGSARQVRAAAELETVLKAFDQTDPKVQSAITAGKAIGDIAGKLVTR